MNKVDIDVLDGFGRLVDNMRHTHKRPRDAGHEDHFLLVFRDQAARPHIHCTNWVGIWNYGHAGWGASFIVYKDSFALPILEEQPKSWDFTLNMPRTGMKTVVNFCNKIKNNTPEVDRFKELKLTAVPSQTILAPIIGECGMHFECVFTSKDLGSQENSGVWTEWAAEKFITFHGTVTAAYADEDIAATFPLHDTNVSFGYADDWGDGRT